MASSNVFAMALGGVLLALGGYYVGARSDTTIKSSPSKPVYGTPVDFARAIEELRASFSEDAVTTAEDQLKTHGFSPNAHLPGMPYDRPLLLAGSHLRVVHCVGFPHSVVIYPHSTEDVVKIVNVARKYRMPIVPYSGGTSLEGHFAGVRHPRLPHITPCHHLLNISFVLPL